MGGKRIIDIAIKTPLTKCNQFVRILQELGYKSTPEHLANNKRIFLKKEILYLKKENYVHVHLVLDKYFWKSFIAFRDYLRNNDSEIREYAKIKRAAVKYALGNGKKYREYKDKYLKQILKLAFRK